MITVFSIICKKCKDEIYSRTRHDFRWCSCKSIAIDGGQKSDVRICGEPGNYWPNELNLDVTLKDLYDDWNTYKDKYGLIKGEP